MCEEKVKCKLQFHSRLSKLNLQVLIKTIQKQKHYFANKGPSNQGYGFSIWSCMDVIMYVVMYGCESWTIKKVEC